MSRLYLVRHGQAGTRQNYDSLSDLGREQARRLGSWFASENLEFAAAYTGTLARQEQTALEVRTSYEASGRSFPAIVPDCGWNEFDLTAVFRALSPRLCAEDAAFAKEYEEMRRQARASADQPDAAVNRRWLPCDSKLVEAWVEGRYRFDGESWPAFRERVLGCRARLADFDRDANIAVFSSATPIGIWTALAMEIHDARALRLAGVLQNTSCTVVRVRQDQVRLYSFNSVSHLCRPELRTYR